MSKLLDPKVMMAIKDLPLAAKTTIEGFMNGINKSAVKGPGMEFSQYRSYQPGDDLRLLDWKMFARSDRYYIRESEIETNISLRLVLDASASMNHQDGAFTKIDYARYLAASLAYLGNLQGDAVGLHVLQQNDVYTLPTKQDFQHLSRLFFQLEQIKPEGRFTDAQIYKKLYAGSAQKELTIFISDLYQFDDEIFNCLDVVNSLKHEVIVFHLMSRNELELNFKGYSNFEDLETGATIEVDQSALRTTYQNRLAAYLAEVRQKALNKQIYYRMLCSDEPLDQAIRDFLNQRKKLKV
jgi:uncharacterized protein (DUF58 family)